MRPLMTKYEYALTCALRYKTLGFESMYKAYMNYIESLSVAEAESFL